MSINTISLIHYNNYIHTLLFISPSFLAPEFTKRLNPFNEVEVGDNIVFECHCKSFPKPTIKWYKGMWRCASAGYIIAYS